MSVVIADTSPIHYLLLIGEIDILHRLYGEVVLPNDVVSELAAPGSPREVSAWIQSAPEWVRIRQTAARTEDPRPALLDPGERAAILLASQEPDVLLLIDDAAGRAEASRLGIPHTGTLGVLRAGAIRGFLSLPIALKRLAETNFRVQSKLVDELLAEDSARSRSQT